MTRRRLLLAAALLASTASCTVSGDGDTDAGGGGGGTDAPVAARDGMPPGYDATCEALVLRSMPGISNVLIVLDRSSSMYREAGFGIAGVDRWNPAVAAVRSVTSALDDRIQFGLMLFANPDAPAGMTLCGAGKLDVPPAPGTFAAIDAELTGDPNDLTGSWTPTAVSLDAARVALADVPGRNYVLLLTDGAPNCNGALDGRTCRCGSDTMSCADNPRLCIDSDRTVAAVEALREAGIETFVVGYDTSIWADVLDRMAAAGGTDYTAHIPVGDEASLEAAMTAIAGSVISCNVELAAPPDAIQYVNVTLDGVEVPHESVASGGASWALVGDRQIELRGEACATLRDGAEHVLGITRECYEVF
jgi:hypothetical protein